MPRGRLKVYLGVVPGAGKTHALLDEARRRLDRGNDVVIGAIGTRDRATLETLAAGVERVGDGLQVQVGSLLVRRPDVVVVDDLHELNPPGLRHAHRFEDVEDLLTAGIDVVCALDLRFVASLAEPVTAVLGAAPVSAVPDRVVLAADQLQVIDIAPQALRRRLAHGGLFPPEQLDAVRSATYRLDALAALRELCLGWAVGAIARQQAARPDLAAGVRPPEGTAAPAPPPGRERVLVALSGGPETERLLHRAARLVARMPEVDLLAVHVLAGDRLPRGEQRDTSALRELARSVGAGYQQVFGDDVAAALLAVAEAEHVTQLVVGADAPAGPLARAARLVGWRGSDTAARLVERGADLDVHVVGVPSGATAAVMPPAVTGLPAWRRRTGLVLAVLLPLLLTGGMSEAGPWVGLAGHSLLFLLAVVITSLVGGLGPALLSAVVGSTLLNYYFIPPVHTFRVAEWHNVITLIVFVAAGVLVSAVVHRAASLAAQSARAAAESRSLAAMAGGVLRGQEALPTLLEHVRTAFGMTSASLLEQVRSAAPQDHGGSWRVVHSCGAVPPQRPPEADVTVPAGDNLVLALAGRTLAAADRTMLRAFAAQAQGLLERDRLARTAAHAARLEATERLRDALLAAVGHDLRTPLASATAAVSSLRAGDVTWTGQERQELLATAEESLDRLGHLVADLLDLSRLRAGVLTVASEPLWLDDVLPPALGELGPPGRDVVLHLSDDLPPVLADGGLLTRAMVNVIGNAVRHSPPGIPPVVTSSATGGRVEVRIIDRGPGVTEQDRERIFVPFRRLGDVPNGTGLGLGLALSRGLVEAMHGTLEAEDTPGGGLTMVLSLVAAADTAPAAEPGLRERREAAP